jgi:hypothetical protein
MEMTRKIGGGEGSGEAIQPGSNGVQAGGVEQNRADSVPSGRAKAEDPQRGIGDNQPQVDAAAQTRASSADQGPWAGSSGDDLKAGTHSRSKDYRDAEHVVARLQSSPLAHGEDKRDYDALAREIHDAVQPKNIFDHMRVADLIHSAWEEGRYREQRIALPHATRFKAAVVLLMPFTKNFEFQAGKTALDYVAENRQRASGQDVLCASWALQTPQ